MGAGRMSVSCEKKPDKVVNRRRLQVQFLTTGGGTWRASPNLYNCGKVCCYSFLLACCVLPYHFTKLQHSDLWKILMNH